MEKEIWKDIPGYDGLYQISSLGNIKSILFTKKRLLKSVSNSRGYKLVNLWKNKKYNSFRVHRLVAQAFILNKYNKPQVNHINGIKTDNRVQNLEWCTASENVKHSWDIGLCTAYTRKK